MARTFSTSYNQKVNSVSADEYPLILVQLDHPDLVQPIRVVNDRQDLTHQGNNYTRFSFRFSYPTDPENGIPEARLEMDNVGKELMDWVEAADYGQRTTCTIKQVLRSNPDVAEYEVTMDLTDIKATQYVVSGRLSFEELLSAPGLRVKYTPVTAPGLF